jgi:hypothetical protein
MAVGKSVTKKSRKAKPSHGPSAIQVSTKDGTRHVVGIGNLRVLIVPDEKSWFAQGVEIDYGAQGDSVDDAKKNFERGFFETIDLHLRMHGNIEKFLVFPPSEVLREVARNKGTLEFYTQVSAHDISGTVASMFPFAGIDYLVAKAGA